MLQPKDKTSPSTLQKVEVEVIGLQECKDHYKQNPVTERMFCATADGKDSCKVIYQISTLPLFHAQPTKCNVTQWKTSISLPYQYTYVRV